MKTCNICGKPKPRSDYRNPNSDWPAKCKECRDPIDKARYKRKHKKNWADPEYRRKALLRTRYNNFVRQGVQFKDFNHFLELVKREKDGCEICGGYNRLALDHNHNTKQPRGILCQGCNQGLGCLSESKTKFYKAGIYLDKYEQALRR